MGILHKDLQERNVVYDEFINHLKDKIHADETKNTTKNEWMMETYDNEVKKADRGDAYAFEKSLAIAFGSFAAGMAIGGTLLDQPAIWAGAVASSAVSVYNYIKFKRLTLGRSLGTRMFYAETLQKIVEENGLKFPFNAGEFEDYEHLDAYMKVIRQMQNYQDDDYQK